VLSHALAPHAQLEGFSLSPFVWVQVGTLKCAHIFAAWLQYMFESGQRFGAPFLPQAHGAALTDNPLSLPHAQHLGASTFLTHGSLAHIKWFLKTTSLLFPLFVQKSSTCSAGTEPHGAHISVELVGTCDGFDAILSTHARPQSDLL
jgi:hypothetical protein